MHLVSDLEGWKTAQERGLPFYRRACGGGAPRSQLTADPALVRCPICASLIQEMYAAQAAEEEKPELEGQGFSIVFDEDAVVDFGDEEDEEELEVDLSMFGDLPDRPPDDVKEADEEESDSTSGLLEMVSGMVAPMLEGVEISDQWDRWTVSPDEDPEGPLEGENGRDLRQCLTQEELGLLSGLSNLSSIIGLSDLSAGLISIIHRQAFLVEALSSDE